MAYTQAQWYTKIKRLFPVWFFENEDHQEAHLQAFAKILEQLHEDIDDHITETFIMTSVGIYLDAHGEERSTDRLVGEYDGPYRVRVQSLKNRSNPVDLKTLVDALLISGVCTITEDEEAGLFMNRETFLNRGYIIIDPRILNTFSVIVDKQIHDPYSFLDREYFLDREDFIGQHDSSDLVFSLIEKAVNDNKALGTAYRIIERTG